MDPFVAEVRIVGFNFAPTGWAQCNGQILPISQNTALFSLLGTTYGGNGQSTFALPDMQGNACMHPGQGPGLSLHDLGEMGGASTTNLLVSEMPAHAHQLMGSGNPATTNLPGPTVALARTAGGNAYKATPFSDAQKPIVNLAFEALPPAGGGLPHNNMMPSLVMNYVIALQGVFPPRT